MILEFSKAHDPPKEWKKLRRERVPLKSLNQFCCFLCVACFVWCASLSKLAASLDECVFARASGPDSRGPRPKDKTLDWCGLPTSDAEEALEARLPSWLACSGRRSPKSSQAGTARFVDAPNTWIRLA